MWPIILICAYCALIVASSLAGGWLPSLVRLTHIRMQLLVSFVAGLMLGVSLFLLLPHAGEETGSLALTANWTMIGLLAMFFLNRAFHFHQHGSVEPPDQADHHGHAHELGQACPGNAAHSAVHPHKLSWIGVAFGLALHTLIDGVALAASVLVETPDPAGFALLGVGTFLAIVLHKPLDAMSITSLMAVGGWSRGWRLAVNVGFAMMCPLGAALFALALDRFITEQHVFVGCALAFSAGVFLCISLADLLPEVQFHRHDRFALSAALLLGIGLAYATAQLEPAHVHPEGIENGELRIDKHGSSNHH